MKARRRVQANSVRERCHKYVVRSRSNIDSDAGVNLTVPKGLFPDQVAIPAGADLYESEAARPRTSDWGRASRAYHPSSSGSPPRGLEGEGWMELIPDSSDFQRKSLHACCQGCNNVCRPPCRLPRGSREAIDINTMFRLLQAIHSPANERLP